MLAVSLPHHTESPMIDLLIRNDYYQKLDLGGGLFLFLIPNLVKF